MQHWQNRTNLYRKLGLHPRIFENTNVLEVGPGSGENSIDLLNRGISSLKLSDALPKVLESLQEKISTKIPTSYEIHDASVAYTNHDTFEIVICEGVIPLQMDPAAFFLNICSRVKPGGILLITTFDSISGLAEVLRRVISAPILQRTKNSKQATVEELTKLFHEDFRPISMTPNLHLDQHWYKSYFQNQVEKNSWINSYKLNCHQLLDFRIESKIPSDIKSNTRLQRVCEDIFVEMQHLISDSNPRKNNHLGKLVEEIINECPQVDILTKNSLKSFADYSRNKNTSVLEDFRPFWGRGQQYLCFEKEKNN